MTPIISHQRLTPTIPSYRCNIRVRKFTTKAAHLFVYVNRVNKHPTRSRHTNGHTHTRFISKRREGGQTRFLPFDGHQRGRRSSGVEPLPQEIPHDVARPVGTPRYHHGVQPERVPVSLNARQNVAHPNPSSSFSPFPDRKRRWFFSSRPSSPGRQCSWRLRLPLPLRRGGLENAEHAVAVLQTDLDAFGGIPGYSPGEHLLCPQRRRRRRRRQGTQRPNQCKSTCSYSDFPTTAVYGKIFFEPPLIRCYHSLAEAA